MFFSYPKRLDQAFERGGLGRPSDCYIRYHESNPYTNDALSKIFSFACKPVR